MNNFSLAGSIRKIFETEKKSDKFLARNFVLEYSKDKYPQLIQFQLTQANVALLDAYSEGDDITVHFSVQGRQWNDKYFTNLVAYKLERAEIQRSPERPPNDLLPEG